MCGLLNGRYTHIGRDVVRCRADDEDLLPDDETSLTLDPAVLLLTDLTLPCSPIPVNINNNNNNNNNNNTTIYKVP